MKNMKIICNGYDYKKGLEKFARSGSIVLVAGLISVYSQDPKFLALIPILEVLLNFLKHNK